MEAILFGIAVGSFICAGVSAVVAGVLHRSLGVHDAINFLRNKKVAPASNHVSKKKPNFSRSKVKEEDEVVVEPIVADSADSPTDIIRKAASENGTSTLFDEETEKPTTLLQDDAENPTQLLQTVEDTERPTSLLNCEDDTEKPTSLLASESEALDDKLEIKSRFDIVQSEIVVHTREEI